MWRTTLVLAVMIGCHEEPDEPVDPDPVDDEDPPVDDTEEPVDVDVDDDGSLGGPDGDDCDDADAAIHPGASDNVGDDLDQNCDGVDGVDVDGDGWASPGSGGDDCADDDPAVHPDAEDAWYDGVDANCDRACEYDADGDGALHAGTDPATLPGSGCGMGGFVEDCNDEDPLATTNHVTSFYPADGAVGVDPLGGVSAHLDPGEPGVVMVITDPTGAVVPIETFSNQSWMYDAEPLLSFDGQTTYDLAVTHSCGTETMSFTTGPAVPAVDPQLLIGTWAIDASSWGQNSDPIFGSLFTISYRNPLAFEVLAATETTLDLRVVAVREEQDPEQDLCVPTIELLSVPFDRNPTVRIEGDLPIRWQSSPLGDGEGIAPLIGGGMTLTFREEFSLRVGQGLVDTRLLDPIFESAVWGAADSCAAALASGEACVACPDGSPTCLPTVEFLSMSPARLPDLVTVPRSAADIAADPDCP